MTKSLWSLRGQTQAACPVASCFEPESFIHKVYGRTKHRIPLLIQWALVLLVAVMFNGATASANVFANPGFELPVPPNASAQSHFVSDTNASLVWKTTHPVQGGRPIELWSHSMGGVISAEGVQHVETSAYSQAMIFQTIALAAGQYSWSFCHRGRLSATAGDVAEFRIGIPGALPAGSLPADPYYYPIVTVSTSNNGTSGAPSGPSTGVTATALPNGWVRYAGTFNYAPVGAPLNVHIGFFSVSSQGGPAYGNFIDDVQFDKKINSWCCPGDSMLSNGDFEALPIGNTTPPTWPGFVSQYSAAASTGLGSTLPGQFNIVTGNQALATSSTWNVADHTTCNPASGKFMVVNGRTTQTAGTNSSIWKETVMVKAGTEYRFCANVKNLPQCSFDVKPIIRIQSNQPNASMAPVTVNVATAPCSWQLISNTFVANATGLLTLDIRLDESGQGDGNDLALDDISLQEKQPVPADYVAFSIATSPPLNGQYHVTATYPSTLPAFPYGYFWQVCEIDASGQCIPLATASNPPQWWTYPGPPGPAYNGFNGYVGAQGLSGAGLGVFDVTKKYHITFGVWSDCESLRTSTWLLGALTLRGKLQVTPVKVSTGEFKIKLPPLPLRAPGQGGKVNPGETPMKADTPGVKQPIPGAKEADLLPRAEADPAYEIGVAKPTVQVGEKAPDFKFEDDNGQIWRLSDLRTEKNVLLTFFPKCFTGGCANHLSSLRDHQAEFDALDTQIIAVSVDPAAGENGQRAFADQWQLKFPLVPDTARRFAMLYGAAQNEKQLAARMSIFIDKEGVVRFIDTQVNVRAHGAQTIERIRELGLKR